MSNGTPAGRAGARGAAAAAGREGGRSAGARVEGTDGESASGDDRERAGRGVKRSCAGERDRARGSSAARKRTERTNERKGWWSLGASREKLSEALLRGESARRDPFSWILRTSLLVVPLSPPPHHAHSTERIASPAHPLRSYPAAAVAAAVAVPAGPAVPAPAPDPAASSPEDRRGLLSFRDHRARPDVDSTTSGTRGQCAAERRAVTSGESRRWSASAEYGVRTIDRSTKHSPRRGPLIGARGTDRRYDRGGVTLLADRISRDVRLDIELPLPERIIRISGLSASRDRGASHSRARTRTGAFKC